MREMYTTSAGTAPDKLEERRVYRFKARNFFYGAWNGKRDDLCGFIGVREKFGSEYLFTEYHCDTGGSVGTVWAIEPTEHHVPEGIELVEYVGSFCQECDKPVESRGPGEVERKNRDGDMETVTVQCIGYTHLADEDKACPREGEYMAYLKSNAALFEFLKTLEEEER